MTQETFNPNPQVFQEMAAIEDEHWWFVARRMILNQVITQLPLPKDAEILEAGCGTGGNLAMLAGHGRVYAMDVTEVALKIAKERQIGEIQYGCLPDDIPFVGQNFDLIVTLDVVQHVDDDVAALKALSERLKPGGWLLVALPANPWMWSKHDDVWQNKRRYTKKGALRVVRQAGLKVNYSSYFNFILFPLIAGVRLLKSSPAYNQLSDQKMPSQFTNRLLTFLFGIERHIIGRLSIPFGVSILLIAQKEQL